MLGKRTQQIAKIFPAISNLRELINNDQNEHNNTYI